MKLYMHPVSNTSRPVRMFIADNHLQLDDIALFKQAKSKNYVRMTAVKSPNEIMMSH
jgi:hypothetical protein